MQFPKYAKGTQVKVIEVAYPDLPRHARFIGMIGVVFHQLKSCGIVRVRFPNGEKRDCHPLNIERV